MPLISDLTVGPNQRPPMILPPFDIEWVWYCHTLNPVTKFLHNLDYITERFYLQPSILIPSDFEMQNATFWDRYIIKITAKRGSQR